MEDKSRLTEQMPAEIGRYKIQECIGQGAMGEVYKAFDPLIKRTLAIKTIRLDIPKNSAQYRSFIERFYHEARISGTLSHPNIVTLFDIGEDSGRPYLAMEFVEGDTVAQLIERGERFKPEPVIALASQIASALDYAHGKGIIHRDVKPSNLILFESDRVKITDFGIAKLIDAEMTQSGTLLGTPSYMSPEQAMGDKLDGRSDIFSLGVVCFEMLSGEQPFPGNNVTSILYKLVHVDPIEPANLEMNGLVPQKWHEVFGKVLAKSPAERYQTAGAFVQDLEYCLGSWFGSLQDPTTVMEATMVAGPASGADEPTVAMPALASPADDSDTIVLKAPAAGGDTATVVLKSSPAEGATAVLSAAPAGPAPPGYDSEATIVLGDSGLTVKAPVGGPPPRPPKEATRTQTASRTIPPGARTAPRNRPVPETSTIAAPRVWLGRVPVSPHMLVGGVAALAVLALVVAGFVVARNRPATVPPPVATPAAIEASPTPALPADVIAPAHGALHVETMPGGAVVTVNGEVKGTTPLDLAGLPTGSYEVKIELKGYDPRTETVSITPEAPRTDLSLALSRAGPAMASVDILSTPFGATVTIDGIPMGLTPLTDISLKVGSHSVELAREGYEPWSGTLIVAAGRKGRVDALLRSKVAATPAPIVNQVDTSRIYNNTPSDVDTPARKASGPSVGYPDGAPKLKSGESVSVSMTFVVTEEGEVTDPRVVESGGKVLDDAVLAAVRTWKYTPAVKKGTRVKVRVTHRQTFRAG